LKQQAASPTEAIRNLNDTQGRRDIFDIQPFVGWRFVTLWSEFFSELGDFEGGFVSGVNRGQISLIVEN
jgi:hypothetical protein